MKIAGYNDRPRFVMTMKINSDHVCWCWSLVDRQW